MSPIPGEEAHESSPPMTHTVPSRTGKAREAVKLDPSFADPHAGLGFLYVERGQLEESPGSLAPRRSWIYDWYRCGKSSASFCFFSARTKRRCGSSGR